MENGAIEETRAWGSRKVVASKECSKSLLSPEKIVGEMKSLTVRNLVGGRVGLGLNDGNNFVEGGPSRATISNPIEKEAGKGLGLEKEDAWANTQIDKDLDLT